MRQSNRFKQRVVLQFRSPENVRYLCSLISDRLPRGEIRDFALKTLHSDILDFSRSDGRIYDLLDSDSLAQRGAARGAVSLWGEVRRINLAFYEDRLAFFNTLQNTPRNVKSNTPLHDGIYDDDEQFHMRMFIADSLRPPGLEHLNTPGPLYELREDQSTWIPEQKDDFLIPVEDAPWRPGNANRTPEEAQAEYWGDNWAATETTIGAPELTGVAYGDQYGWGNSWKENGGTRFMRYETIPFWQKGGREGYDYDIEETLGTASRELDGHVRRWDMDRVRKPRGKEYRRYGPRSGYIV